MADDKGKKLVDLLYGQPTGSIRPTEVRNPAALGLGQALQKGHEFVSKPFGYPNPPAEMISEFLGVPAIARTLERLGYGEPLTTGKGMTTKPKEDTVEALLSVAPLAPATKGMPVGAVIKPKGGNWLTGSVERSLAPLRDSVSGPYNPTRRDEALKNWIDRNLANYVKKEMATPEDPVRKLAEQGITHMPLGIHQAEAPVGRARKQQGFPASGMGQSELARRWEDIADESIVSLDKNLQDYIRTAGDIQKAQWLMPEVQAAERNLKYYESELDKKFIDHAKSIAPLATESTLRSASKHLRGSDKAEVLGLSDEYNKLEEKYNALRSRLNEGDWAAGQNNPWVEKLDPKTPVYDATTGGLGFDHIIDVLREDLATGRIRPEQLNKVSMEQAVRRTHEYDQELAKKMAEAKAAARAGLPVYKEYPEKYRWIELNRPGAFASESEAMGHSVRGYEPPRGHPDWTPASGDLGSESYGHGGWEAIKSGKAKVYSLVDEKGQPHVTVEVKAKPKYTEEDVIQQFPGGVTDAMRAGDIGGQNYIAQKLAEMNSSGADRITQIKGKQNAAPKEEYLPFVQDFVKSGQWSDVGDLRNSGLRNASEWINPGTLEEYKKFGLEIPKYATEAEFDALHSQYEKLANPGGQAHGGRVHISNNPDTMRLELAGGGALSKVAMEALSKVKLLREEMAAKAALQAQYAKEMEGVYTKDMPTFEQWKATQEQQKAGGGSISKLAKLLRAPAKTRQEIEAIAERMAPQVTGEYVREKPKSAKTVAGKTAKQFEREKNLPVDIRATDVERVPEKVDVEKLKDQVAIGIAGDPTVTGKTLYGVGETRLASPAPQHGGPLYGLYNDEGQFWASGLGAARKVQNLARQASQQYDAPVLGNYVMMGPDSINYAQHFADANLQAIDLSKMTAKQVEGFNDLLRQGSPKSGPRPSFPGIEDKGSAYLHLAFDPELRKYFNQLMQQPTVTEKFGLPSGQDIRFAITEPELQNLERGVTGFSLGRMNPEVKAKSLKLSEHPTYSHDIPGEFIGQTKYPIPYELSFPDTLKAIRENPKQAPHEFGSLKMVGPRQIIDQQLIDEIKAYEERMKALTGKKKGGAIKKAPGGEVTIPDMTDGGKVIDGGPFKKGGKVRFTDNLDAMQMAVGRK